MDLSLGLKFWFSDGTLWIGKGGKGLFREFKEVSGSWQCGWQDAYVGPEDEEQIDEGEIEEVAMPERSGGGWWLRGRITSYILLQITLLPRPQSSFFFFGRDARLPVVLPFWGREGCKFVSEDVHPLVSESASSPRQWRQITWQLGNVPMHGRKKIRAKQVSPARTAGSVVSFLRAPERWKAWRRVIGFH